MSNESFSAKAFKFIKKQCILSFISIFILLFGSLLIFDSKINPIPIDFPDAPELTGSLEINEKLTSSKVLHFRKVKGCESLVHVNGYIYSTTQDGKIVRFNDTHVEVVTKLNPNDCRSIEECGRPLGIRYDIANNRLLVVDAYLGLFEVDINRGTARRLFPKPRDAFRVTFFNDLDILSDGDVIVSESSTKYQLHNLMSLVLEGRPNGRLLRITPSTGEHRILVDNLYFPNGVQISRKDPNSVLVAETMKLRVLTINIDGNCSLADRKKVFVDHLPGFPDNLRPSFSRDGYWISFATIRHSDNTYLTDVVAKFPFLRNSIKKLFSDSIFHLLTRTAHGIIIRIDEFGSIVESLHDTQGMNVSTSSEILEVGKHLYLGNYYLPFLIKITL